MSKKDNSSLPRNLTLHTVQDFITTPFQEYFQSTERTILDQRESLPTGFDVPNVYIPSGTEI